jgi:hypothetical protein
MISAAVAAAWTAGRVLQAWSKMPLSMQLEGCAEMPVDDLSAATMRRGLIVVEKRGGSVA